MGYAHGSLLKDEINQVLPAAENYIVQLIEQNLPYFPDWLLQYIAEFGELAALDVTYWLTSDYIADYWIEEFQGM